MTRSIFSAILSIICVASIAYGEVIGPWNIQSAPISASFESGGGPEVVIRWINTDNSDITLSEALSGMPVINDGLGNLPANSVMTLNFSPGSAMNIAGTDLVLFEARFEGAAYRIYTNYDNFSSSLYVGRTKFVDTSIENGYYYGLDHGPFEAQVWGTPIDLSELGVPLDVSVDTVRVVLLDNGGDPLGVGSLSVPEPSVGLLVLLSLPMINRCRRQER